MKTTIEIDTSKTYPIVLERVDPTAGLYLLHLEDRPDQEPLTIMVQLAPGSDSAISRISYLPADRTVRQQKTGR